MHTAPPISRVRLAALGLALVAGTLPPVLLRAEDPLPHEERLESSPVLRHLRPNPVDIEPRTDAERALARMHVPEGFRVELVAAEPDIHQPIAFTIDERGRLWVVEAHSYPVRRPDGEGLDRVRIFEDSDGDGHFETRKVFIEGLNLASGIAIGHGGVWIGAAPELLFIPDRDRDDRPDGPPEVLLDGFGYQDTHETLNSFRWGPDGWLYGLQGVFNTARIGRPEVPVSERPELRAGVWRFHPVRHEFEIFAHGGSNAWGLDHDEQGNFFMTHCRSYWGRGPTTHVLQGGHFWNQVNANHAPFIIANPPAEYPEFRNYLLASARYGHGAGGAGPRGSDAIYGGHSHVGTMIYLGDNWPDTHRGRLFTHNLGGHQINQQVNQPLGSGFDTVHAGADMLFCTDPSYVAVDLQYGPDGAVYIIDWVDSQHCHNPNTERWDRSNGRIYRMQWQATYRPVKVDLGALEDAALVALLGHRNHWYARTARRLLHERGERAGGRIQPAAQESLRTLLADTTRPERQLQALWTLAVASGPQRAAALRPFLPIGLRSPHPQVRAATVTVAVDAPGDSGFPTLGAELLRLAQDDPSPVVRLALAAAIQRVPAFLGWDLAAALARHGEDATDRNLPPLLWHGLAPLITGSGANIDRALGIAASTTIPQLADWIHWYLATLEGQALDRVVTLLGDLEGDALHRRLAGLWIAMEPRANLPMPAPWQRIAPRLYANPDPRIPHLAERLASVFGDATAFPRLRTLLADVTAAPDARRHAFSVLARARDHASLDLFLGLLDDAAFRPQVIPLLARFDSPAIAPALVARLDALSAAERATALNTLSGQPAFALVLLDAVREGTLPRDALTAWHVRQLTGLGHAGVEERVAALWGPVRQTPAERLARIERLEQSFNEAPLWAYSASAGRRHFETLCAACHRVGDLGRHLGPDLTGAGRHGVRYYLENIIDPDAVVGPDFQLTTLDLRGGGVLAGLVVQETASAVTLRTTEGDTVVPKSDIGQRENSGKSLMPEGLLDALEEREQIELLKFLTSN